MQQDVFVDSLVNRLVERKQQQARESQLASKPSVEELFASQFDVLKVISKPERYTKLLHLAKRIDPAQQACCKTVTDFKSSSQSEALIEEATKLEICQHPNVGKLLKLGQETKTPYILMEWVFGESLADKIQRFAKSQQDEERGAGFRQDHVAWLIYQVAGALEYVHSKGIVHLDVKPANILVGQDDSVKLIDFGSAQYVGQPNAVVEASLKYASKPYIETGKGTPQDDVYSLALVALSLLAGRSIEPVELRKLVKSNRGPKFVSGPIWHLMIRVIDSPRDHGFTPMTFAKEFGQFDSGTVLSGVPIFAQLRNADLVLTQTTSVNPKIITRQFFVDSALFVLFATCLFITAHHYVLGNNNTPDFENVSAIEIRSNDIASLKPALLFTTPVWELKGLQNYYGGYATEIEQKLSAVASAQIETQENYYQMHKEWLDSRQKVVSSTNESLIEIRNDLKNIAELLRESNIKLDGELEQRFLSVFMQSQKVLDNHQRANFALLSKDDLANAIRQTQHEEVGLYLNQIWEQQQALNYELGYVLRQDLADVAYQETLILEEQNDLKQASSLVSVTSEMFPESHRLIQRKHYLLRAKSEQYAEEVSASGVLSDAVEDEIQSFESTLTPMDKALFRSLLEKSLNKRSKPLNSLVSSEKEPVESSNIKS